MTGRTDRSDRLDNPDKIPNKTQTIKFWFSLNKEKNRFLEDVSMFPIKVCPQGRREKSVL